MNLNNNINKLSLVSTQDIVKKNVRFVAIKSARSVSTKKDVATVVLGQQITNNSFIRLLFETYKYE